VDFDVHLSGSRLNHPLTSALPTLHDLTECSPDLAPRLTGCDAAVVFGLQCRLLSVGRPSTHAEVYDLLPSIDRPLWFAWLVCRVLPDV
jgi:hypothetical protein